ncbi:hypothetical protein [Flavobacterium sp.]|uniref:hypothetical protein n=1 Tax=Flavobacterium sp. TaxID=239 RepID=UPI002631837B|nr:hypothetical protein [Flavobacterium sp.]
MLELIIISITLATLGSIIYFVRYKDKGKPKVGVKRNNNSEYLNNYSELKLYWSSIFLFIFGLTVLIAILIIELIL